MARAQGARAVMLLGFESAYGTAPAEGSYFRVPFVSSNLGMEQPLLQSEVLGYGRDPIAPIKDAISVDGDVVIPLDAISLGYWLKGAFGTPGATGAAKAAGKITFSAQPANNSTVTINGTAFTFVSSGPTGNQVLIGANLAATMTALAAALNASVISGVAAATYVASATELGILHDTLGLVGNAFTLAASTSPNSHGTPSGLTLIGGLDDYLFSSGKWNLPSMSIEIGNPEVPFYALHTGCMVDKIAFSMKHSGLVTGTVSLIAQGQATDDDTVDDSITVIPAMARFGSFHGKILKDGVALGNVVSADFTYANNLDRIETIRNDGMIDGADPSMCRANGTIVVRFADTVLLDIAKAGTPMVLSCGFLMPTGEEVSFDTIVVLSVPKVEIAGPGGVQVTFDWEGYDTPGPFTSMVVVHLFSSVVL